jgi:hypothetical protein
MTCTHCSIRTAPEGDRVCEPCRDAWCAQQRKTSPRPTFDTRRSVASRGTGSGSAEPPERRKASKSVNAYLRHIKLYGAEGVLDAVQDERSLLTSSEVVQILRAATRAGLKLTTQQKAQAVRGMARIGIRTAAIASVLDIGERQAARLRTFSASEGDDLWSPNMSEDDRMVEPFKPAISAPAGPVGVA